MTIDKLKEKNVGFVSLGCDKNRVDLEKMIFNIKSFGLNIVNDPSLANIIIINTCSFLESSRMESIENILEMSNYKNDNLEKIIVTGCLNQLNYSDLNESLPEVDAFVSIEDNDNIVSIICGLYNISYDCACMEGRVLTTPNHFAYLKIAEGCNNFCSYCLIPYIRGRYRSRKMEDIMLEARSLADMGVKELILVAQDVTKYGVDLYDKKMLSKLINELSQIDGIQRIRLLYCYPEEIDDELIEVLRSNEKVVKYIDIPLQHISNKILKSMNRKSTKEKIFELFDKLKNDIPNIAIRTTFILGFPDETEEDFVQIIDFLNKYKLDNVGFFKYSREEGTRSYNFENQIDEETKESRLNRLSQIQFDIQYQIHKNLIGQTFDCLVDETYDNYTVARYYGQCPQIDGYIIVNEKLEVGKFYKIKITDISDYDLIGERL